MNLQKSLCAIDNWCKTNNMVLNHAKSTCTIITTALKHRTLINNSTHLDLHLNGVPIETVKEQKLLGNTIHSTLSWKPHINNVCINIHRKIVLFKRIVYFLNEDIKKCINMHIYNQFLMIVQLFGAKICLGPINYMLALWDLL